jgi:hypothetical protein
MAVIAMQQILLMMRAKLGQTAGIDAIPLLYCVLADHPLIS